MRTLKVDFKKSDGRIKMLHGVNNAPMAFDGPVPEFAEAQIPIMRTHDTCGMWGGAHFVDVQNIFPDMSADPENPDAYDFAFTDAYLKSVAAAGTKIFYRLGSTIENQWKIKAYHIYPPDDPLKWAKVCAGIIRHYNDGWANGFLFGIEYWEIWNEPENPPMWQGTREQYFELYRVASTYLKKEFPQIKVGGYASCGFYSVTDEDAKKNRFYRSFLTWFDEFLKFVTNPETKCPLDFFSWHLYSSDTDKLIAHAGYVSERLNAAGLSGVENIFDEWNFIEWDGKKSPWEKMKLMPGAAFVAEAFCRMQDSGIDKAMYYDACPARTYCGLFNFPSMTLTKTMYAFKAFSELYKLGISVKVEGADSWDRSVTALAARKGKAWALFICNRKRRTEIMNIKFSGDETPGEILLLDAKHDLTPVKGAYSRGVLKMPPMSIALLRRTETKEATAGNASSAKKKNYAGLEE